MILYDYKIFYSHLILEINFYYYLYLSLFLSNSRFLIFLYIFHNIFYEYCFQHMNSDINKFNQYLRYDQILELLINLLIYINFQIKYLVQI